MNKLFLREIFYYENHYLDFFEGLPPDVKKKFNWTLQLIATTERVPEKYFKHITNSTGIYEVRVEVGSNIFRVFSFLIKEIWSCWRMGSGRKRRKPQKKN